MISNIKIFLLCPIPEDQKPINEYINLKENNFTNWLVVSNKELFKKLFFNFFYFFLSFSLITLNFSFITISSIFFSIKWSLFLLIIVLFLTDNQWKEISKKFNTTRLFYEEASWFDGQIWNKPFSIIRNDRLILINKIKPITVRNEKILKNLVFVFSVLFLLDEFFKYSK